MGERRSLTGSGAPGLSLEGHADRAPSDDGFESPSSPGHDKDAELEAKIRQVFAQLDEDNSGSISTEELDEMLKMLGMEDEDRAVRLPILVQHMDSDGDGVITEVEFVTAAIELGLFTPREDPNAAKLARAMIVFDEIDNDGNRSLDHVELQNVLIKLGCHDEVERDSQAEMLIKLLDEDGDGEIGRDEFAQAVLDGVLDGLLMGHEEEKEELSVGSDSPRRRRNRGKSDSHRPLPDVVPETAHIPQEKRQFLWNIFNIADDDGGGTIGVDELFGLLSDKELMGQGGMAGRTISREFVETVMGQIDESGDGELDYNEFCVAFEEIFQQAGEKKKVNLFSAETHALTQENTALQLQLKQSEQAFEDEKAMMQMQISDLGNQVLEAHESSNAEIDRFTDQMDRLKTDNTKLKRDLQDARITIEKLEHDVEYHKKEAVRAKRNSMGVADVGAGSDEEIRRLKKQLEIEKRRYMQDIQGIRGAGMMEESSLSSSSSSYSTTTTVTESMDLTAAQQRAILAEQQLEDAQERVREHMEQMELKWSNEREDLTNKLFTTEKQLAFYMEEAKKTLTDKTQRARDNALPTSELTRQLEKLRSELAAERSVRQQSQEELEAFKVRTAQMWQLQQDSVKAQLDEAKEGAAGAASELRLQLDQARRELSEHDTEHSVVVAKLEAQIADMQAKGLEDQLAQLNGERADAERRLQEVGTAHAAALDKLRNEHESIMASAQEEFSSERTTLQTEITTFRTQLEKLQKTHEELSGSLSSEKGSRGKTEAELAESQKTVERLTVELKLAEQKLREERASREADKSDMTSLRAQLETKDLDKEQYLALLDDVNSRVNQLTKQLEEASAQRDQTAADFRARLQERQAEFLSVRTDLETRLSAAESEAAELRVQRDKERSESERGLEEMAAKLQERLLEIDSVRTESSQKVSALNIQLLEVQSLLEKEQSEQRRLREELEDHEADRQKEKASLIGSRDADVESVNSRVKRLKEELVLADEARAKAAEEFLAKLKEKQAALRKAQEEKEALGVKLRKDISALEEQNTLDRQEHEKAVDRLQEIISDLRTKLSQQDTEKQALVDGLQAQIRKLEAINAELSGKASLAQADLAAKLQEQEAIFDVERGETKAFSAGLQSKVDQMKAEMDKLRGARTAEQEEMAAKLKERQVQINELESSKARLESSWKVQFNEQVTMVEHLNAQLTDIKSRAPQHERAARPSTDDDVVRLLRQELAELREAAERQQTVMDRLKRDMDARKLELEALFEAERGEFELEIRDAKSRLEEARDDLQRNIKDRDAAAKDFQKRLGEKQARMEELQTERDREVMELKARIAELEVSLQGLNRDHDRSLNEAQSESHARNQEAARGSMKQGRLIKELQLRLSESEKQLLLHSSDIERLRHEYEAKMMEREALLEAARVAGMVEMQARLRQLEAEVHKAHQDRDEAVSKFMLQLQAKQRQVEEVQEELTRVTSTKNARIAELEAELADARKQADAYMARSESSRREHETEITVMLEKHEKSVNLLRGQVGGSARGPSAADLERASANMSSKLKEQEVLFEAERHDFELRMQERDARIAELQALVDRLQGQKSTIASDLQDALANNRDEIAALRAQADEAMAEKAALEVRATEDQSRLAALKVERDRLLQENSRLTIGLTDDEAQAFRQKIVDLNAKVQEHEAMEHSIRADLDRREAELQAKLREKDALFESERGEYEHRLRQLQAQLEQAKEDSMKAVMDVERLEAELRELRQQKQRLISEQQRITSEFQVKLSDYQRRLQEASEKAVPKERAAPPPSRPDQSGRLQEMQERIDVLETEVDTAQADAQMQRLKVAELLAQIEAAAQEQAGAYATWETRVKHLEEQLAAALADRGQVASDFELRLRTLREEQEGALGERDTALAQARERVATLTSRLEALELERASRAEGNLTKISELEMKMVELQSEHSRELQALREQITARDRTINELTLRIELLTGELEAARRENEQLRSRRPSAEHGRLTSVEEELRELQDQLRRARDDRAQAAADFQKRLSARQAQFDESMHERDMLVGELKQQLIELQAILDRTHADNERLRRERSPRKQVAAERATPDSGELQSLRAQLREAKAEAAGLRAHLARLEALIQEKDALLLASGKDSTTSSANFAARMRDLEAEIQRVITEREAAAKAFREKLGEQHDRINRALADRQEYISRLQVLQEKLMEREAEVGRANHDKHMAEVEASRPRPSSSEVVESEHSTQQHTELSTRVMELEIAIEVARADADRAQASLREKEELIQAEDLTARSDHANNLARLRMLEEELLRAKTDRQEAASQFRSSLQDQRAKLEAALVEKTALKSEIGMLTETIADLKMRLSGLQAENGQLNASQLDTSGVAGVELVTQQATAIQNLKAELRQARADVAAVKAENDRVAAHSREQKALDTAHMVAGSSAAAIGLQDATRRIHELENMLDQAVRERDAVTLQFRQRLNEQNTQMEQSIHHRRELDQSISRLTSEQGADSEFATQQARMLADTAQRIQSLQRENESLTSERDSLKRQLVATEQRDADGNRIAPDKRIRELSAQLERARQERERAAKDFTTRLAVQQSRVGSGTSTETGMGETTSTVRSTITTTKRVVKSSDVL